MIKLRVFLLIPLWVAAFSLQSVLSKTSSPMSFSSNPGSHNQEFMTSADMVSGSLSNLSIKYTGGAASITVTGIYIFNLTSNPNDCTTSALFESLTEPYGILWAPKVTIAQNDIKQIGANYLYNMMMRFLYGAYVGGYASGLYTPGNAEEGSNEWCLWLGITNQTVGTDSLTSTNGALNNANQLVQYILGDPPISFTHVTCNDSTRTCSTADTIQPQPFPHQRP